MASVFATKSLALLFDFQFFSNQRLASMKDSKIFRENMHPRLVKLKELFAKALTTP